MLGFLQAVGISLVAEAVIALIYAAYRRRARIEYVLVTILCAAGTACIRYADFVNHYLFDPVTRTWDMLIAVLTSFFGGMR